MAPNPLAELRAAHPELGISDPPSRQDWERFAVDRHWQALHDAVRDEKQAAIEAAHGGTVPRGMFW